MGEAEVVLRYTPLAYKVLQQDKTKRYGMSMIAQPPYLGQCCYSSPWATITAHSPFNPLA